MSLPIWFTFILWTVMKDKMLFNIWTLFSYHLELHYWKGFEWWFIHSFYHSSFLCTYGKETRSKTNWLGFLKLPHRVKFFWITFWLCRHASVHHTTSFADHHRPWQQFLKECSTVVFRISSKPLTLYSASFDAGAFFVLSMSANRKFSADRKDSSFASNGS